MRGGKLLFDAEVIGQHNGNLGFQKSKLKAMLISLTSHYFPSFDLDCVLSVLNQLKII